MTIQERIAKVLEEHRYKVEEAVCSCSDFVQVGLRCDDQTHEQHVAAVLAGVVAEAQAEAWDAAFKSGGDWANTCRVWFDDPPSKPRNPYREGVQR